METGGQIKAKRETAARARRLALEFTSDADRSRALAFEGDLEAEADALEQMALPPSQVAQIQVQAQQGPPAKDDDKA